MSPAITTASSWSSMQSRSSSRSYSMRKDDDLDFSTSLNSSRYRVLDENQKKQETDDVERIINELEAQRQSRSTSSRVTRSSSRQKVIPVVPIQSRSPHLQHKSERFKSSWRSSGRHFSENDFSGDELLPGSELNPVVDAESQSFQDQVMEELRKLKNTQRIEFEALERLQREKEAAEDKALRLEKQLKQQQRQFKLSHSFKRTKTHQEMVLVDDTSDDENNKEMHSDRNKDACYTFESDDLDAEENDPHLIDWDDATKSPPPYRTTASPATSPFKRSSGWPAWTGDESVPPGPETDPPESSSSEPTKPLSHDSLSQSKLERTLLSRSRSSSAMSSHVHRLHQSRSRSPSATRSSFNGRDSQELRRSGAFFEDKARAKAEAEQLAKDAVERLKRARHAAPPQKLLERQALADQRRSQQLKELEKTNAEVAREKRAKARDVPVTTYKSCDAEEAEQKRKERIHQRAQEMIQTAELPPRMAVASRKTTSEGDDSLNGSHMSVKMKKKVRETAEEEARRRTRRPKPVPNFDQLHSQWDATLKRGKELARRTLDEEEMANYDEGKVFKTKSSEFFTSRADKLTELRDKKEARKQRHQAKEQALQQHAKRAQEKLLARARNSLGKDIASQKKPTKSETLRVQKLLADTAKQHKERLREEREADARERRQEAAARRVCAQVKRSENVRRDNFAGEIVDLKDLDAISKEKAREQRQQFKEAIARNKEKLLTAAATRPSLMERFTTGVKRETHRRAALEAVVKTVFQKDLSVLKGVLTDDEQELAREMVAVDDQID